MGPALKEWHDFYLLIGTAAATLVGLMYVVASIGTRYFTPEREAGLHMFLTPTVVHFSAILVTALVVMGPFESWSSPAAPLVAVSLFGLAYAVRVWFRMRQRGVIATIDLADRAWYALTPVVSYLLIAAAAILLGEGRGLGLDLLAEGVILLLLLGLRNAWDMTVWVVIKTPGE